MLLAGAGWLLGFDGGFKFVAINDSYVAANVPYIGKPHVITLIQGLRLLPAVFGALGTQH